LVRHPRRFSAASSPLCAPVSLDGRAARPSRSKKGRGPSPLAPLGGGRKRGKTHGCRNREKQRPFLDAPHAAKQPPATDPMGDPSDPPLLRFVHKLCATPHDIPISAAAATQEREKTPKQGKPQQKRSLIANLLVFPVSVVSFSFSRVAATA